MQNIFFSQDDIANVQQIIEKHEGEPWTVHQCVRDLRFHNKDATAEFWLSFLFDERVTVHSVTFMNKWTETFTEVMTYCEQFAKSNRVGKIVIQSIGTPGMAQWCKENGYQPNKDASVEFEGVVYGDYEKDMDAERERDAAKEKFMDLPIKIGDKVRMNVPEILRYSLQECMLDKQYLLHMIDHPNEVYTVEKYNLDCPVCPYILSGAMAGPAWADDEIIPVSYASSWFDVIKNASIDDMANALSFMLHRFYGLSITPVSIKASLEEKA